MCYNGKGWRMVFVNFEMKSSLKDLHGDKNESVTVLNRNLMVTET